MEQEIYSFSIKDAIKSLKLFPKIFDLLWSVSKSRFILIVIFSIVSGIMPAISILTTKSLLNAIQTSVNKGFNYVLFPLIVYLVFNSLSYITSILSSYIESLFRIDLNYKLNILILEKAKSLDLRHFENSEIYDGLRRAQNEGIERPYIVLSLILQIVSQLLSFLFSLVILLYWKPWVILIIIVMPIISTIYISKMGYMQYKIEYERAPRKRKAWYLNFLITNDIAFKEIKIYRLGDYFIENYKKLNRDFIFTDKKIIKKRTIIFFLFEILDQLVGAFMLLLIITSAYTGEILLGNTVAYIRSLSNVKGSMEGFLGSLSALYQNNLYIKQLFDFLEIPINQETNEKFVYIKKVESIEFIDVSFKYPNREDYALRNISFKIEKGETISIVGDNGSGKSTLVKLLSGLYDDYEGQILINGISIKNVNRESLSERIGIIFQDFSKYELSCRENIGTGQLKLLKDDVLLKDAIDKACANEIIDNLPEGLNTQLGVWFEEGVQLSLGQWQKIAISRAFLRNADVYIFDEPSSSLDPISENEILQKSQELTKDKISIFISHRLYNLKRISSRILVLKNGELIEEGTHEELMTLNSYYKYLYDLQNINEEQGSFVGKVNYNT